MTKRGKKTWQLLVGCMPMLRGYVRRLADSEEHAEEIFQEVSLQMLSTEGPDDPERYGAWGRGVVRHVIAHDWRKRRRARAEQPFEEDAVDEFVEPPTDPEAHLDARACVERIVGDLDSEGVELLYRRYVLQESGKELADELERSPASMRMRLMRLRSSVSVLARTARDGLAVAVTLASAAIDCALPLG
jgi:RNA polymerase sigma factor (sigma-70 family)